MQLNGPETENKKNQNPKTTDNSNSAALDFGPHFGGNFGSSFGRVLSDYSASRPNSPATDSDESDDNNLNTARDLN